MFAIVFDPTNPFSWLGGGAFAASIMMVVYLFSKEVVVPGPVYKRRLSELESKDEIIRFKETEIDRLHTVIEDKTLDTLLKAENVLERVVETMRDARERERSQVDLIKELMKK